MSAPALSVVVPAFDEATRIGVALDRLAEWAAARSSRPEILVVDDGSADRTAAIVADHSSTKSGLVRLLRLARNRGKGAALKVGVGESRGDAVLVCDADLSTPIEEVDRLLPLLESVDVVLGSRDLPESKVTRHQPWLREVAGKLFNLAIRTLGVRGFRDTQCGFKLFRGGVARRLFSELTIERFAFDVELVWLAQRDGFRIAEVGVEWHNDPASRVRFLRDGLRMLVDVLRIRWRHRGRRAAGADGAGRPA